MTIQQFDFLPNSCQDKWLESNFTFLIIPILYHHCKFHGVTPDTSLALSLHSLVNLCLDFIQRILILVICLLLELCKSLSNIFFQKCCYQICCRSKFVNYCSFSCGSNQVIMFVWSSALNGTDLVNWWVYFLHST